MLTDKCEEIMTKDNQKKLYDHFVKLSKDGKDDIQKANCKKYAAEILKSFPDFAKKPEQPKKEEKKKERNRAV